jgi:DNA-binding LacI/PurR family transcriptional regulator
MAITIRDVAQRAGTSTAAVSAVLHGTGKGNIRVGEATRARILAAARDLGFVVNPLARSLATGRTGILGVIFPFLSTLIYQNPFCIQLLGGITEELIRSGYDLLLNTSIGDAWADVDPARLIDPRVDGLIVVAPPVAQPLVPLCLERRFPCVPVIYPRVQELLCTVNVDDFEGGKLAGAHLIELGHRRICHLAGPDEIASSKPRAAGFRAAMLESNLAFEEDWIIPAGFDWKDGHAAAMRILERPAGERPTAIFAANDLCADGVLRALRETGHSVPHDFSVVGFDDTGFATRTNPPLTTIHAPIYTMGILAANLAISQIEKRPIETRHPVLPVSLTIRDSTASLVGRE